MNMYSHFYRRTNYRILHIHCVSVWHPKYTRLSHLVVCCPLEEHYYVYVCASACLCVCLDSSHSQLSSTPLQVLLYLNSWYFAAFFLAEVLIFVYKGQLAVPNLDLWLTNSNKLLDDIYHICSDVIVELSMDGRSLVQLQGSEVTVCMHVCVYVHACRCHPSLPAWQLGAGCGAVVALSGPGDPPHLLWWDWWHYNVMWSSQVAG